METAIYGILFWTPLLLDALLTHNFDGKNPSTHTNSVKENVRPRALPPPQPLCRAPSQRASPPLLPACLPLTRGARRAEHPKRQDRRAVDRGVCARGSRARLRRNLLCRQQPCMRRLDHSIFI